MYIPDTEDVGYTKEDLNDHHGVAAVIFNNKGEMLIQNHVKYSFWTIPVGKAKPYQTPEKAIIQEMKEECDIELIDFEEFKTFTRIYARGRKMVQVTAHIFRVNKYKGTIRNIEPDKHKEQVFLPIAHIRAFNRLSDVTLEVLKYLP